MPAAPFIDACLAGLSTLAVPSSVHICTVCLSLLEDKVDLSYADYINNRSLVRFALVPILECMFNLQNLEAHMLGSTPALAAGAF